jgi:hypothetical protein
MSYLAKARAMVSKVPGFFYSSYRQTAPTQSVLIRMDTYQDILKQAYSFVDASLTPSRPAKQRLFVRVLPGTSRYALHFPFGLPFHGHSLRMYIH